MSEQPSIFYYAHERKIPLELVDDTLAVGFNQPISDLSRGASVDDIVTTCAVVLAG